MPRILNLTQLEGKPGKVYHTFVAPPSHAALVFMRSRS